MFSRMDSKPTSGALIASSGPYIVCTNDELPVLQNLIGVGGELTVNFGKRSGSDCISLT